MRCLIGALDLSEYEIGMVDGYNGDPCKAISMEYIAGYKKGLEVAQLAKGIV